MDPDSNLEMVKSQCLATSAGLYDKTRSMRKIHPASEMQTRCFLLVFMLSAGCCWGQEGSNSSDPVPTPDVPSEL